MREDLERKVGKIGKKMDEKSEDVMRDSNKMRKSWERERKEINKKVEELGERIKRMELQERRIEKLKKKIGRMGKEENLRRETMEGEVKWKKEKEEKEN